VGCFAGQGIVTGSSGILGLSVAELIMYGWSFTILLGLLREWSVVHLQVTAKRRTNVLKEIQLSWEEMVRPDYHSWLPTRVEFASALLFLASFLIKVMLHFQDDDDDAHGDGDGGSRNGAKSKSNGRAVDVMSVLLALAGLAPRLEKCRTLSFLCPNFFWSKKMRKKTL